MRTTRLLLMCWLSLWSSHPGGAIRKHESRPVQRRHPVSLQLSGFQPSPPLALSPGSCYTNSGLMGPHVISPQGPAGDRPLGRGTVRSSIGSRFLRGFSIDLVKVHVSSSIPHGPWHPGSLPSATSPEAGHGRPSLGSWPSMAVAVKAQTAC